MGDNLITFSTELASDLESTLVEQINRVAGALDGKLLHFRDAVLARVETNKNGDELDDTALQEIAATLPLMAIDEEHDPQKVVGVFIRARVMDGRMPTEGYLFADRFPEIAADVQSGKKQLSVEANADFATCSICAKEFTAEDDYCLHLKGRPGNGAKRKLRGMRATGGAVVKRPAGTDTKFDPSQMMVLASFHQPIRQTFMNEVEYRLRDNPVMAKALTSDARNQLKDSNFALIQKKDGRTLRRFPIPDCSHAQNALARVGMAKDMSDAERSMVKTKAQKMMNSQECKPMETKKDGALRAAQALMGGLPQTPLAAPKPTPVSNPIMDAITKMREEIKNELVARIEKLEAKLVAPPAPVEPPAQPIQASDKTTPASSVLGLSWETKPAPMKIEARW